jgi:hypothetical protein
LEFQNVLSRFKKVLKLNSFFSRVPWSVLTQALPWFAFFVIGFAGLANPDNVHYLAELDLLFITEDTLEGHQNDVVWQLGLNDAGNNAPNAAPTAGALTRIFSTPFGAEATGVYGYTLGEKFYMLITAQHPYTETDYDRLGDPESTGRDAWIGYFGPVDLASLEPGKVRNFQVLSTFSLDDTYQSLSGAFGGMVGNKFQTQFMLLIFGRYNSWAFCLQKQISSNTKFWRQIN